MNFFSQLMKRKHTLQHRCRGLNQEQVDSLADDFIYIEARSMSRSADKSSWQAPDL